LYAAQRFIHSSDPNAPPLYEVSHSLGFLGDSDRTVRLWRTDHTIKTRDGIPQRVALNRLIFNLRHPTVGEYQNFEFQGEAACRGTIGSFGIVPFRKGFFGAKCYRVHRAVRSADRTLVAKGLLFTAIPSKSENVGYEWRDDNDQLVAREVNEDDLMRLVIGMEMSAVVRDALVSAWILRMWNELRDTKGRDGVPGSRALMGSFAARGDRIFRKNSS